MCNGRRAFQIPLREWEGAGGRGGDWDFGGAVFTASEQFKSPSGSGEGAGGRGGARVVGDARKQKESVRNAPPFLRGTSKKGAAGRTLSAAERLSSYDKIATYPSDI